MALSVKKVYYNARFNTGEYSADREYDLILERLSLTKAKHPLNVP